MNLHEKEYSIEENISQIKNGIEFLNQMIQDEVSPTSFGFAKIAPKMLCKIDVIFQVVIRRMIELADGCIGEYASKRYISCASLSRAVIETFGIYHYTNSLVEKFESGQIAITDFDDMVMRIMFGTKITDCEGMAEAVNILTILKKKSLCESGIFKKYEILCEYTHPNYLGLLGAYSDFEPIMKFNFKRTLDSNDDNTRLLLGHLPFCLMTTAFGIQSMQMKYAEIASKFSDFKAN